MRSFCGGVRRLPHDVEGMLNVLRVKGFPSCHFTSFRRKNTRFRYPSCQDHFSARSPMIVSGLSVAFRGSKSTRLLRQGIVGHTVEMVEVSWIAKPWGRSSGE